jgi:Fur family transcriptional regulator, ferric uptake regulator
VFVSDARADDILDRLRDEGGRVTATRRVVIDAMLASPSHHLTAADVVEAVRRSEPGFHPSTVYRTLDRLTELGVVDRIQIGAGPAVHHLTHRPHHHLVCEACGAVQEAPDDLLDAVAARVARDHGFALNPATSALQGLCAACVADAAG